jgi:hypothetical protein
MRGPAGQTSPAVSSSILKWIMDDTDIRAPQEIMAMRKRHPAANVIRERLSQRGWSDEILDRKPAPRVR